MSPRPWGHRSTAWFLHSSVLNRVGAEKLPEDSTLFNLEKPARIKVGEDLIELHFISFEDNKAENKLGNIKTSLRK